MNKAKSIERAFNSSKLGKLGGAVRVELLEEAKGRNCIYIQVFGDLEQVALFVAYVGSHQPSVKKIVDSEGTPIFIRTSY